MLKRKKKKQSLGIRLHNPLLPLVANKTELLYC